MNDTNSLVETEVDKEDIDPQETPIRERRLITQPYDIVVESFISQIERKTIFLRPLSERPRFQRRYVWKAELACKLVESVLLNIPIPPCYLSQNDAFELDVIDGQQRLYTIYRFCNNQFTLKGLTVLKELNGLKYHEMSDRHQRQISTHTLRMIVITNESHPEIKFEVFERLNTNTVPLNSQELRNCVNRGSLIDLLKDCVEYKPWLKILRKSQPDTRMRDEELALRFFAFHINGVASYKTPQKFWLNETAQAGRKYSTEKIANFLSVWKSAIDSSLELLPAERCYRRAGSDRAGPINKALFDLTMSLAARITATQAKMCKLDFERRFRELFRNDEFLDLISRAVDHKSRTIRRFELWDQAMHGLVKDE